MASQASSAAFTERLPCNLNDEERALKADQLAREVKHHAEIENSKKLATAKYSQQLKASDTLIGELAVMVRTGVEYREIGCYERPNLRDSTVEIIRMDDGTISSTRPMEPHEKQAQLFEAGYAVQPPRKSKTVGPADETEH